MAMRRSCLLTLWSQVHLQVFLRRVIRAASCILLDRFQLLFLITWMLLQTRQPRGVATCAASEGQVSSPEKQTSHASWELINEGSASSGLPVPQVCTVKRYRKQVLPIQDTPAMAPACNLCRLFQRRLVVALARLHGRFLLPPQIVPQHVLAWIIGIGWAWVLSFSYSQLAPCLHPHPHLGPVACCRAFSFTRFSPPVTQA